MFAGKLRALRTERKRWNYWLLLLPLVATYYAYAIVAYPFPDCLPFIFWPPLLVVIFYDIRWGIGIWYVLSALGNMFVLDLPGIVPLRPTHLILLLLLGVWFVKSYKEIPAAVARFLSKPKNKVLLILLGWIALAMVMGRLTGVTQQGWKYQFNAWFAVALAICVPLLVSNHTDKRFLQAMIWVIVVLGTTLTAIVLATGVLQGAGLHGWKTHYYEFVRTTGLIVPTPLFLALVFFPEQKWWGKIVFGVGVALSLSLKVLMIFGGSRSSLLFIVTLGFLLLFTRPRLLMVFAILVILPVMALNVSVIESWVNEQIEYRVDSNGVLTGRGTRVGLAVDAARIIKNYPVWGTGSDYYRQYSNVYVWHRGGVARPAPTVHNTWLQAAVDHGVFGSILLAAFLGFVFKDTFQFYRSLNNELFQKYILLFLAGFSTTIVASPFGQSVLPVFTGSDGNETATLASYLIGFWLSYGMVSGIENWHKRQSRRLVSPEFKDE